MGSTSVSGLESNHRQLVTRARPATAALLLVCLAVEFGRSALTRYPGQPGTEPTLAWFLIGGLLLWLVWHRSRVAWWLLIIMTVPGVALFGAGLVSGQTETWQLALFFCYSAKLALLLAPDIRQHVRAR